LRQPFKIKNHTGLVAAGFSLRRFSENKNQKNFLRKLKLAATEKTKKSQVLVGAGFSLRRFSKIPIKTHTQAEACVYQNSKNQGS
jgi:hypothetical protein